MIFIAYLLITQKRTHNCSMVGATCVYDGVVDLIFSHRVNLEEHHLAYLQQQACHVQWKVWGPLFYFGRETKNLYSRYSILDLYIITVHVRIKMLVAQNEKNVQHLLLRHGLIILPYPMMYQFFIMTFPTNIINVKVYVFIFVCL